MSALRVLRAAVIAVVFASAWTGGSARADQTELTSEVTAKAIVVKVSIATQTMYVHIDGALVHTWSVSTARHGYKTPLGSYEPYWLHKNHRSRIYDNAPMPYAVFFLGGYAVHGTTNRKALGKRASHGCVRLLTENARTLYLLVEQYGKQNTKIIIEA